MSTLFFKVFPLSSCSNTFLRLDLHKNLSLYVLFSEYFKDHVRPWLNRLFSNFPNPLITKEHVYQIKKLTW